MSRSVRTERVLGTKSTYILKSSSVAIVGIGGVGSGAAEAIARAMVGTIILMDGDAVAESNLNRQLCALYTNIGENKTLAMAKRLGEINPGAKIIAIPSFYGESTKESFFQNKIDYIIDAIDSFDAKIDLIKSAKERNIPIISAMGAGNKLNVSSFEVSDIYKTSVCPFAKKIRSELKKEGVESLKVVFSKEMPAKGRETDSDGRQSVGSVPWVPPAVGLIMAGEAIMDLVGRE